MNRTWKKTTNLLHAAASRGKRTLEVCILLCKRMLLLTTNGYRRLRRFAGEAVEISKQHLSTILRAILRAIRTTGRLLVRLALQRFDFIQKEVALNQGIKSRSIVPAVTILSIAPLFVTVLSYIEGTWFMPGTAKGLMEHYGAWALFLTSPLILILTLIISKLFTDTVSNLEPYMVNRKVPSELRILVSDHLESLRLITKTRYLLDLFMITGAFCALINIKQTIFPYDSYANDIFDTYPYPLGFISFKVYLSFIWTTIYPFAAYIALHVTVSMVVILRSMCQSDSMNINMFHQDNCGGVSVFGNINLLIMTLYACVISAFVAIFITHEGTYVAVVTALLLSSVLFILQSLVIVYHIHDLVATKKRTVLQRINEMLNSQMSGLFANGEFSIDLLGARNHIMKVRTVPYSKGASALVNFLRFAPAAFTLATRFLAP